jgi:diguanylate cyclase (GGDEF)-like protein
VSGREALQEALQAGADDYITKPLMSELLHVRLTIAERQVRAHQKQKQLEEDLMRDALRDALTGLPNRRLFLERLDRAARQHREDTERIFSVLYIDLDDIGRINEQHERDGGDEVLREVGRRLDNCLRPVDTVARMAEDEFALLLDGLNDASDAVRFAEKIHESLSAPVRLDEAETFCSACIGIALSVTGFEKPSDMIRDAKTAELAAREEDGGSSHRIFDPVLHAGALARVHLESRLRLAVEREEMVLHYQPIVSMATGEVTGFEALIRWEDPERGLVFPDNFIGLAEETGIIIPIGWWGLEEACRQLKDWQERFPRENPISVGVNFSSLQFDQPDFYDQIEDRLARFGLHPNSLHVEITESSLMADLEGIVQVLERLKARSVRLHIDDFGTGYSSLSYLCRIPIHTLKIDRSFVVRMMESSADLEIVRTIVQLARNLELSIIAEGVETRAQFERLKDLGCDEAQGYLFSRAIAVEQADALLAMESPPWEAP